MENKKGLYLHIPFCVKKCDYCDFYSVKYTQDIAEKYIDALISELEKYKDYKANTLYLGGGTPSLLPPKALEKLLKAVNKNFGLFKEATIEVNPAEQLDNLLFVAKENGINRVSIGLQSGNEAELKLLTRRHTAEDVKKAVESLNKLGLTNFSLDVMLATPKQTKQSLLSTLKFANSLNPTHISSYILKLEQGTPYFLYKEKLNLPNSEEQANLYLTASDFLTKNGYEHYEISNFCKAGYEAQHNLKYWNCQEYIGIGPSAHGFLDGKRYFYSRNLEDFIKNPAPVFDCVGGTAEEKIMLKLRLKNGITFTELKGIANPLPDRLFDFLDKLCKNGLANKTDQGFFLTPNGFLVSNTIITEILDFLL